MPTPYSFRESGVSWVEKSETPFVSGEHHWHFDWAVFESHFRRREIRPQAGLEKRIPLFMFVGWEGGYKQKQRTISQ